MRLRIIYSRNLRPVLDVMTLFRTSDMFFRRALWNDNETTESLLILSRGKKEGVAGDSEESQGC